MPLRICGILLMMSMFAPITGFAELDAKTDLLSEKEIVLQENARKRLYPGGRDEDDLIIHPQAIVASRKFNKREIEKEVYKQLFNEDLKGSSDVEDSQEADVDSDD